MKHSPPKKNRIADLLNQIKRARTQDRRHEIAVEIIALPDRSVIQEAARLVIHEASASRFIAAFILASNGRENPGARDQKIGLLTQLLDRERNPRVMARAIASLSQYEGRSIDDIIEKYHTAASVEVRRAVAICLDFRRGPQVAQTLIRLTMDRDSRVRELAAFSLGQNGSISRDRVIPVLRRLLADRSKAVRAQAFSSLMGCKDYESLPWLTDYARRQKVKWDERREIIQSLDKLLERAGFDETVRDSMDGLMWNLFDSKFGVR